MKCNDYNCLARSEWENNDTQFIGQRLGSSPKSFPQHAFWIRFLLCCKNCSVLQVYSIYFKFKSKGAFCTKEAVIILFMVHNGGKEKKIFHYRKNKVVMRSFYKAQHREDSGKYLLNFNLNFILTSYFLFSENVCHCVSCVTPSLCFGWGCF